MLPVSCQFGCDQGVEVRTGENVWQTAADFLLKACRLLKASWERPICDMRREESTCSRKCGTSQSARLAEYVAGSRRIHVRELKRIVSLPAHSAGYHIWPWTATRCCSFVSWQEEKECQFHTVIILSPTLVSTKAVAPSHFLSGACYETYYRRRVPGLGNYTTDYPICTSPWRFGGERQSFDYQHDCSQNSRQLLKPWLARWSLII
jgi:hypothetical protein